MDQPGKVANPARGQLNRENNIPLSPCVPENLVSRDGSSRPVPRQPAHLHTQAESGAYLRDSSRVPLGKNVAYRRTIFILKLPYTCMLIARVSSSSSSPLYCLRENISFDTLIRRSSRGHNSRKATQPSHCGTCLILLIFIAKRVQPSLPSSTLRSNFVYPRQISRSPRTCWALYELESQFV